MKNIKIITAFILNMGIVTAQTATTTPQSGSMDTYSQYSGAFVFVLVAIMFILLFVFSKDKYVYIPGETAKQPSLFKKFRAFVTRSVPIEKEADITFHHDFDGIKELDNRIPPWFNFLFYGTIIFAAIYLLNFHVFGTGKLMIDEYLADVKAADEKRQELIRTGSFVNENNVTLLTDAASLDAGKTTFTTNCVPCHGPDGGGIVGPNLTDQYWIHGGGIKNVFKTIKYGVPIKGMISWQTVLTPKKMQEVASYILSLQGTKPANPKAPEGNIYTDSSSVKTDSVKVKTDSVKVKTDSTKIKADSTKIKKDTNKVK
jgi:cytochrome c oxidase cbb3-type subunit III